ncbi:unnamed protein product [Alternaria alternata]
MRRRGWARKVERYCCTAVTYFPLVFVYGLTSWAVWVQAGIGFVPSKNVWTGKFSSTLGIFLYLMLNWSYTTAVFTDPGSPLNIKNGYSHLPSQEGGEMQYTSFTVKASTGELRFCNKCQSKKPDRSHHCSTCKRCVLKMDHHCPWLATCVGLRNYKAFVLFLLYLSFFCWVCFATSATWVWSEILSDGQYTESFMPVNYVLLAVLSGIIGIGPDYDRKSGEDALPFTTPEHDEASAQRPKLYGCASERTFECWRSVARDSRERSSGVTRPEEGEPPSRSTSRSPVPGHANGYSHPHYQSYEYRERQQYQDRYDSYLDERDNEMLPNAFDLGWKRNIAHVFGPSPLKWFIPLVTTTGDGWSWEPSPKWLAARERIKREREREEQIQKQRERAAGWGVDTPTEAEFRGPTRAPNGWMPGQYSQPPPRATRRPEWQAPLGRGEQTQYLTTTNGIAKGPIDGRRSPNKADQILGRERGMYADGDVQLQTIDRKKFDQYNYISEDEDDDYEVSSDEQAVDQRKAQKVQTVTAPPKGTQNWNDIPDGFLDPAPKERKKSASRERSQQRKNGDWDDWGT